MRNRLIYILLFAAIIITVFYSPLTSYLLKDFMISRLEKSFGMTIAFGKTRFEFPAQLTVSDVKALDKNSIALTAEQARFRLDPSKIIKANAVVNCELKSVGIGSTLSDSLNGLLKPLGVPGQDVYRFDDISAVITMEKGSFEVHGLNAVGSNFKLLGEFSRFKDKRVDYDMEFKINKQILEAGVGKENRLLGDEDAQGWYSVKFSVKGDLRRPSSVSFSTGGVKLEVKSAPLSSN